MGRILLKGIFLPMMIFFSMVLFSLSIRFSEAATADLSEAQLEKLVAPIALYPDPLLAQILAASTYPLEVVEAERFVQSHPKSDDLDSQSWDPSVKAVAHYPSVLKRMNDKLDWTQQLGQAVMNQQSDIMQAVQKLRREAKNVGHLKSTPQETISEEGNNIIIRPANPQIIYVPEYNPEIIYTQAPWGPDAAWMTFGSGFMMDAFMDMDFAWGPGYMIYGGPTVINQYNTYITKNVTKFPAGYNPPVNPGSNTNYPWQHNYTHTGPFAGGGTWQNNLNNPAFADKMPNMGDRRGAGSPEGLMKGPISSAGGFSGSSFPGERSSFDSRPFSGGFDNPGISKGGAFGGMNEGGMAMNHSFQGFSSRGGGGGFGDFGGGGFKGFGGGGFGGGGFRGGGFGGRR